MSGGEIKKRYFNNSSFDLRRFISGSEKFLHSICDSIERFEIFGNFSNIFEISKI